jgi:thiamine monophosphate synthase
MLVTDRTLTPGRSITDVILEVAAHGSVAAVQLREKDLPAAQLLDIAVTLKAGLPKSTALIVNDRIDGAEYSSALARFQSRTPARLFPPC